MSHPESMHFFRELKRRFPSLFSARRVLEIGSLNINGTIRDLFDDCTYVGIDLGEGPGVDAVAEASSLDYPDRSWDVVVSSECFEHNPYWIQTFLNMKRMASRLVAFSCASPGRPEHGTRKVLPGDSPFTSKLWDYYMPLSEDDFENRFFMSAMFEEYEFETNDVSHDLYFWGVPRLP